MFRKFQLVFNEWQHEKKIIKILKICMIRFSLKYQIKSDLRNHLVGKRDRKREKKNLVHAILSC